MGARASVTMGEYAPGELNVKFKVKSRAQAKTVLRKLGLEKHVGGPDNLWALGRWLSLKGLKPGKEIGVIEKLMQDPSVDCAELNGIVHAF